MHVLQLLADLCLETPVMKHRALDRGITEWERRQRLAGLLWEKKEEKGMKIDSKEIDGDVRDPRSLCLLIIKLLLHLI